MLSTLLLPLRVIFNNYTTSLNGLLVNSSLGRINAEWAIDSEAMRARGIIVLVKSNWMVKNVETKQLKPRLSSFFAGKHPGLFAM